MEENNVNYQEYEKHYSEENFIDKLKNFALKAGAKVIYAALKLYYALKSEDTPAWAKAVITGALGYFILPIDLIPDVIPGVGFVDDFGVLAAALATIAVHITPAIKEQARQKMKTWFGDSEIAKIED